MRDTFHALFEDAMFAPLFPARGQPAAAPWRLALVTIFQFAEGLGDQQAADAVRSRIDWKYALSLKLTDAGFDSSVLCEFRARILVHAADEHLLDIMLTHFRAHGLLKVRGRQRTDSTYVLTLVRIRNRLACVNETVRFALNSLATVAPDWLHHHASPEWYERYSPRTDGFRLPKTLTDRQAFAERVGADGFALLQAVYAADAPAWLREVPAIQTLRRIWVQQYYVPTTSVRWRVADDLPPSADMLNSPYDLDAATP
jgi:transposase